MEVESISFITGCSHRPHPPTCLMWSSPITMATASLTSLARESDNDSYICSWRSCLPLCLPSVFFNRNWGPTLCQASRSISLYFQVLLSRRAFSYLLSVNSAILFFKTQPEYFLCQCACCDSNGLVRCSSSGQVGNSLPPPHPSQGFPHSNNIVHWIVSPYHTVRPTGAKAVLHLCPYFQSPQSRQSRKSLVN